MFIQTEQTPNPQTLKFLPGRVVMTEGTAFFQNMDEAADSPLAKRLFLLDGVKGVFFGSDFITITKPEDLDWQVIKPAIIAPSMAGFITWSIIAPSNKTSHTWCNYGPFQF